MVSSLMGKASYFLDAGLFVAKKHILGYEVGFEPTFQPAGLAIFRSIIEKTSTYLEYGSGGSTIVASRYVNTLVSVESDPVFRRAVEKAMPPTKAELHLLSPYIGVTARWGTPVFGRPTESRIARWQRYPQAPWSILKTKEPNTILIDGRMRVACALESLLHVSSETRLLVDDYVGRNYSAIEEFADLIAIHGVMAEFRKKRSFDQQRCRTALNLSYSDLR
ncbi:hypothetical protein [Bradyrhizobium icense]|uniref:Class I SAM-dependent methyltransferase n=1 Tax=Bradyrhizobium icense TaxID=1274631 RepID=A0A1B1UCE5_9BRAD|nr:hypothetical protein [Bradyrhizobium icense]ANW00423.1 hypothetical protein LMTR13_09845 [Bradyrhizobium icense]